MTEVFLPPKFNKMGNRQLWFFETGNRDVDHFGNGLLTALVVFVPFVVAVNLL